MDRQALKARLAALKPRLLTDKIEDTFGPNQCTSLHLHNDETGETLELPCNGKRCIHCGPRRKALMWEQTTNILGANTYVARIEPGHNLDEVVRGLERVKKQTQRNAIPANYVLVGDATLGYILCSSVPIIPSQRRMELQEWRNRFLDLYHHSVQRIRRSRVFGRMSLVSVRRKSSGGQASPWYRRSTDSDVVTEMEDTDWTDLLAEWNHRDGHTLVEWEMPSVSELPIPF